MFRINVSKGIMRKAWKALTATTLALILSLSSPMLALGSSLTEVRDLIESGYVNSVDNSLLSASSIDEMLNRLGDPYTVYFTAEEYQEFINSMDNTFSGIGVYIEMLPEGVRITSVMSGSPAEEAGLKAEDIIIKAAGQTLAGLSQEMATGLLRGPDGSIVQLTILRGEETIELNVMRRAIEVPTVTGEILNGHIGYIGILSFGATTPAGFEKIVNELKGQGVDSWIIDLRDNPGGYLSSALSLAGFFIGDQTAVQTKDRTGNLTPYPGVKQVTTFTAPVMFLTNEYSASASEILAGVVKDYKKATIIGNRTYGKGSVQSMFSLSDGGVLKMTVAKFYSPFGNEINHIGINPDVKILESDPKRLAELLLDGAKTDQSPMESLGGNPPGRVQLMVGGTPWEISLGKVRTPEYWQTYTELIRTMSSHTDLLYKNGASFVPFAEEDWTKEWPIFYPGYKALNELADQPLDKKFTVRFTAPIDWTSLTQETLELIESERGVRIPLDFEPISDREVRVIPRELLEAGKTYWVLTHQGIHGKDGATLREGALSVVKTTSAVSRTDSASSILGKANVQSTLEGFSVKPELYGVPDFKPALKQGDYGVLLSKNLRD
jgi:carboxyl-terminal processing protease